MFRLNCARFHSYDANLLIYSIEGGCDRKVTLFDLLLNSHNDSQISQLIILSSFCPDVVSLSKCSNKNEFTYLV